MSSKRILLVGFGAAMLLLPATWLIHQRITYGPAEHTADLLVALRADAMEQGQPITKEQVDLLLQREKFSYLREIRSETLELQDGELIWISPNKKYSIGLDRDGNILWIVNGKRSRESNE